MGLVVAAVVEVAEEQCFLAPLPYVAYAAAVSHRRMRMSRW